MQPTDRRTLLEAIARAPETGDQARLKALELLDRLDEREASEQLPEPPDLAAELADDAERLEKVITLAAEAGLFDGLAGFEARIEQRAREVVEEQAQAIRTQMAALDDKAAQDAPEGEERTEEPSEPIEMLSGPENGRERLTDERVLREVV